MSKHRSDVERRPYVVLPPANHDVRDYGDCSGVVGGLCCDGQPPLKEHKNNSNPPTSILQIDYAALAARQSAYQARILAARIQTALHGSVVSAEFNPPASITLSDLRKWCAVRASDDWVNKDNERWTAPDCCVGVLRYHSNGAVAGFVPCDMWSCETCAKSKKMRLIKGVNHAFADMPCFFLTLTVNPRKFDDRQITKALNRLKASLQRYGYFRASVGNRYFWVKEFTPPSHEYIDGFGNVRKTVGHVRHIHMLTNFFVPARIDYVTPTGRHKSVRLSDLWRKATDGSSDQIDMTAETELHGAVRASYMTKYITKSCTGEEVEHDFQRYERRFGKSIGLFMMKPLSKHLCFMQPLAKDLLEVDYYSIAEVKRRSALLV